MAQPENSLMEWLKKINNRIDKRAGRILFGFLKWDTVCQVIGHRGAPSELPENTLPSLMKALSDGADGVEFDVVFSQDGCAFVCHDLDVSDRVAKSQQPAVICNMSAVEVSALRIHGNFRIPALKDALEELKAVAPKRVYVHYKRENEVQNHGGHVRTITQAIREAGMLETAVVMVESGLVDQWRDLAPDLQILQCWTKTDPHSPRGFPIDEAFSRGLRHIGVYFTSRELSPWGRRLTKLGFPRLGKYFGFAPIRRLIRDHRRQVDTFTAFTINDPLLMRLCASVGFDAIGSDKPELLSRILLKRHGIMAALRRWGATRFFQITWRWDRKPAADLARAMLADSRTYHPLGGYAPARMKRPEEAFHQRWQMVSRVINEYGARNFCDLGCAEGYYVRRAAYEHGLFAIGIDNSRKMLRSAIAVSELDDNWSCAFMRMDITSQTIKAIPHFDMIACMSLLHHVIHRDGFSEGKALLREIAKKATKCMVFDMGGPDEDGNVWASSLSMLAGDVEGNITNLLAVCGFRNIKLLGHTIGFNTSALRPMFVAEPGPCDAS